MTVFAQVKSVRKHSISEYHIKCYTYIHTVSRRHGTPARNTKKLSWVKAYRFPDFDSAPFPATSMTDQRPACDDRRLLYANLGT